MTKSSNWPYAQVIGACIDTAQGDFAAGAAAYEVALKQLRKLTGRRKVAVTTTDAAGHRWLAAEYASLIARIAPRTKVWVDRAAEWHAAMGTKPLIDALPRVDPWERKLEALMRISDSVVTGRTDHDRQLVWWVAEHNRRVHLEPREQKRRKNGGWTKGRVVALHRLRNTADEMPWLTSRDLAVLNAITVETSWGYQAT